MYNAVMATWIEEIIAASAFVFFSILSAHRLLSGAKRIFNEWTAGTKNPVQDRAFGFPGSGDATCAVPTLRQLVRVK